MEFIFERYSLEIVEFLCVDTLVKIDYGILDLSKIRNAELRGVLMFFEELLTIELRKNYRMNPTGIFRVRIDGDMYCYEEFGHTIEADSLCELEKMVLAESRIWYVFDEISADKIRRR